MMSAPLKVTKLKKNYGNRTLLDIDSLVLEPGQLVVLTGDNGCGKSTLLRILAGLEIADEMTISYSGKTATALAYPGLWRREIIYIHQHPYLFNSSIASNIEYGLKLRGVDSVTRKSMVAESLRWSGIENIAEISPHRLSGGEKQKIALARARVLNPRILLVDEPTANLDRGARSQIVALLRETASNQNCVVVVCHDEEIINLPGARHWHLDDGQLFSTDSKKLAPVSSAPFEPPIKTTA